MKNFARTVGRSGDDVARQLDDLSRATGRTTDDLARDAEALAAHLPATPAGKLRELSSAYGFGSEFAEGVVCNALDELEADGNITTDELFRVLQSAALDAGIGDGAGFAVEASEILLQGDPDAEYDVANLALDQVRTCLLVGI